MATQEQVLELLARSQQETERLVESLTEAERAECGAVDHWAAKDIVAHVAEWERRLAVNLAVARRGEKPPTYPDFDRVNAEIFAEYCARPWDEVLTAAREANRALAAEVRLRTDADLSDPQRNPWTAEQPLWKRILGNAFIHVVSHYGQYYIEHDGRVRADRLQEEAAALLGPLDETPAWRGQTVYNLACHFALAGDKQRALALLKEALQLNPGLAEWSKQDTDLDSLRDDDEYLALFA